MTAKLAATAKPTTGLKLNLGAALGLANCSSTKASIFYSDLQYKKGDVFIFGPETRGLPNDILNSELNEEKIRVPMTKNNRSLNLSNTVAIVLYEAWRQNKFKKGI